MTLTPEFNTGFEHGVTPIPVAGGGLCRVINGAPTVIAGAARTGGFGLRLNPAGAQMNITAQTVVSGAGTRKRAVRFYHRFNAATPSAAVVCAYFPNTQGTFRFTYNNATNRYEIIVVGGSATSVADYTVVAGTFALIDLWLDSTTGTAVIACRINNGATYTASRAQTAADITAINMGTPSAETYTVDVDDWVVGTSTSASSPVTPEFWGAGKGVILRPTSDESGGGNPGTNVMEDTATGNDINGTTVPAYALMDDAVFSTTTDYVQQTATGTGNYAGSLFADIAGGDAGLNVLAVRAVMMYACSTNTAGSTGEARIRREDVTTDVLGLGAAGAGGTTGQSTTVGTAWDMSDVAPVYKGALVPHTANGTDVTGWTQTEVNALRARVGYGTITSSRTLRWHNFGLEVDLGNDVQITTTTVARSAVIPAPTVTATADITTTAIARSAVVPVPAVITNPITFVQHLGVAHDAGVTLTHDTTVGNTVIMRIAGTSGSDSASGWTDSRGNSWTVDGSDPAANAGMIICSGYMATALLTGDVVTPGGSLASPRVLALDEFAGIATSSRVDAAGTGSHAFGGDAPSTVVSTVNGDLIFHGIAVAADRTLTLDGGGYAALTKEFWAAGIGAYGQYLVQGAFGSTAVSGAFTGGNATAAGIAVAYLKASGPPPDASVTTTVVARSAGVGSPTTSGTADLTTTAVALSATIPTPTVIAGTDISITTTAVSRSVSIPGPTVSADANITTTTVARAVAIPSITVTATADVTTTAVARVVIISAPTVNADAARAPPSVELVAAIPTPTVEAIENVSITTTALLQAVTVPTPTLAATADLTPTSVARIAVVPTPTVSAAGDVGITTTTVDRAVAIPTPTVDATASVDITTATVARTAVVPSPIVASNIDVTVGITRAAAIGTPTIAGTANLTTSAVTLSAAIPDPTVTVGPNIAVDPVARSAAIGTPTVSGTSALTTAAVQRATVVPAPTVAANAGTAPAAVPTLVVIPTPTVTTTRSVDVTPATVTRAVVIPKPIVAAQGTVNVDLTAIVLAATVPGPAVLPVTVAIGSTVQAATIIPAPDVTADADVTAHPVALTAKFGHAHYGQLRDIEASAGTPQGSHDASLSPPAEPFSVVESRWRFGNPTGRHGTHVGGGHDTGPPGD